MYQILNRKIIQNELEEKLLIIFLNANNNQLKEFFYFKILIVKTNSEWYLREGILYLL
jgi:hypothetical protein